MKNKNIKRKKKNGFTGFTVKTVIYLAFFALIFFGAIKGTRYYFYESDYAVEKTDLTAVSIDGIKIGMNISEVDTSKYTASNKVIDKCDYNFEELSIKTNSKGEITYVVAYFKKAELKVTNEETTKINSAGDVFKELGYKYKSETYNPEENNYWKIAKYVDTDNKIYFGVVYSRYNNEISKVILSDSRIK